MTTATRRSVLALFGAGAVVTGLGLRGSAPAPDFRKTLYVSSSGDDGNSGSEASPWRSLTRVRAALESGEAGRGDVVLLRRGEVFPGSIEIPALKGAGGQFTLGAYGTGPRPRLSGYKVSGPAWVRHSPNVWKLDIRAHSGKFTGNTGEASTNVGFLRIPNGSGGYEIKGRKRWSLAGLLEDWEFYSDAAYVYVRKATSPGAGVHISVRANAIRTSSFNIISGLHIDGYGAHGVANVSAHRVRIVDNLIENIGGSQLYETTRYGNGVELWIGSAEVLVQANTIRQTYDVGVTMQGTIEGMNKSWVDCRFVGNTIENCNQTFEVWSRGTPAADTGYIRCSFTDNNCRDAGISWAADIRPDRDGTGSHLLIYDMQLPVDIEITRNKFLGAKDHYAYCSGNWQIPAGVNTHHNTIALHSGRKIAYRNPESIEQYEAWRSRTGKEQGSTTSVLQGRRPRA